MKKKIIGVTPRVCTEDGSTRHNVQDTYIAAMNALDFIPIILPMDNEDIKDVLNICDGFLVIGGWDITPSYFGQEDQGSKGCDQRLDKIDKMVVEYAYKTKKPMLGICRGHQSINVFLGGTLIQDIGDAHRSTRHDVETFENHMINFPKTINVNSYHHQVLDKLAPGFIEICRSKEGYNEAIIHESLPIMAFQWHPEKTPDDEVSKLIFKTFKGLFK